MIPVRPENISMDWPRGPGRSVHCWSEVNCLWYLDYIGDLAVKNPPGLFPGIKGRAVPLRMFFPYYSNTLEAIGLNDSFFDSVTEAETGNLTLVEKLLIARPANLANVYKHLCQAANGFACTKADRKKDQKKLQHAYANYKSASNTPFKQYHPGTVPSFPSNGFKKDPDAPQRLTLMAGAELGSCFLSLYTRRFGWHVRGKDGYLHPSRHKDRAAGTPEVALSALLRHYMNIQVCPYCGGNSLAPRARHSTAELDHIFPKKGTDMLHFDADDPCIDFFALLSISLFNLVPTCPTCNAIKSTQQIFVSPYDESFAADTCCFRYVIDFPLLSDLSDSVHIYLTAHTPPAQGYVVLYSTQAKTVRQLYGCGNDAYTFQLAFPPSSSAVLPANPNAPIELLFGTDEAQRFLQLLYDYPQSLISHLDCTFPEWKEAEYARPYSELLPSDFLQIPFAKLFFDLYSQYKNGEK